MAGSTGIHIEAVLGCLDGLSNWQSKVATLRERRRIRIIPRLKLLRLDRTQTAKTGSYLD